MATPAAAASDRRHQAGDFFTLAKVAENLAEIYEPIANQPATMSRAELDAAWAGRLIVIAKRTSLTEAVRKFDLAWLISAILKYRRILAELLGAPFALQPLLQVPPQFSQVIIDKMLLHRGLNTEARREGQN